LMGAADDGPGRRNLSTANVPKGGSKETNVQQLGEGGGRLRERRTRRCGQEPQCNRNQRRSHDVGILDKLFGRDEAPQPNRAQRPSGNLAQSGNEQAIARYRYMLKTAPPETIQQAHAEAFAKLTPEQRNMLLQQLSDDIPNEERSVGGVAGKDDPQFLARLATRAEVRRPGTMERVFGGMGGRGMGMGGMMAGSFLSTIAGVVIGSAIAQSFLGDSGSGDTAGGEQGSEDMASDASADAGSDAGDFDGGDFGEI
jgi:hypothetical protein